MFAYRLRRRESNWKTTALSSSLSLLIHHESFAAVNQWMQNARFLFPHETTHDYHRFRASNSLIKITLKFTDRLL